MEHWHWPQWAVAAIILINAVGPLREQKRYDVFVRLCVWATYWTTIIIPLHCGGFW